MSCPQNFNGAIAPAFGPPVAASGCGCGCNGGGVSDNSSFVLIAVIVGAVAGFLFSKRGAM